MRPCTSRCTYKHAGWKEACDYDKPRCLPRALPGFGRGWGGMLKKPGEAKHTVPKWRWGGWGGRWRLEVKEKGDWMLFPMLILPVCRDHMCVNQALEHPFCLFCLFWSVSLRSLSPSFSLFFSIVLIFKCFYYFVALITSCFCV